jgi:HEPN/Toprim N-terminal domain 1
MGSYAECWLGSFYVGSTKNAVDPDLMQLYRASDKTTFQGKKREVPYHLRRWTEHVEDDEDVTVVCYQAPVSIIRDRLELKGYTLATAKAALSISISAEASRYTEWLDQQGGEYFARNARVLGMADVDRWLAALNEIKTKGLKQRVIGGDSKEFEGTLIGYMLENDWYGYSGCDLNIGLRLAIEVCSEGDELAYDLTDLILSEYYLAEEDFVEQALFLTSDEYSSSGKTIVLTEGRSDSWIISESLRLLYPHLADYFTFMDFDGARVGGGAGNLANIVKSFAGAGIVNKVVALFDNDSAAEAAIQVLRSVRLPQNIQIFKLPEIAELCAYPTIGPSGSTVMNVNGIAASIELYLGADVLSDGDGNLMPVQWTGLEASIGKYQGEVLSKEKIQKRYKQQLETCFKNPELIKNNDWKGIRAILNLLFVAFHKLDEGKICSVINEQYNQ